MVHTYIHTNVHTYIRTYIHVHENANDIFKLKLGSEEAKRASLALVAWTPDQEIPGSNPSRVKGF
jgi:hypothetical protein